jgi:hypothetical protein
VALERVEVGQVLVRHQLQGGRREKMERKKMMAWHLTCTTPQHLLQGGRRENREEEDDGVASDMYTHSVKLDNSTIDTVRGVQELVLIL